LVSFLYPQLLQFFVPQVEQPAPSEEEDTKLPPDEKPKTEKSFRISEVLQWGQTGFSSWPPR
jgi:hypothetical protein